MLSKEQLGLMLILILAFTLLAGCQSASLMIVEIRMVEPQPTSDSTFEDEIIRFTYQKGLGQVIFFSIENKSTDPLCILWDEVILIDADKQEHNVINAEVTLADKDKPVGHTVIEPGEILMETIIPTGNIEYYERKWVLHNIIGGGERTIWDYDEEHISLTIPLIKNGERLEYRFEFVISVRGL